MNGEMYVVKLIELSEHARTIATGILGVHGESQQLRKLREPDLVQRLAGTLDCSHEQVFERFAERIRSAFVHPTLRPFTRYHLQILLDPEQQDRLADLLDCPSNEALGFLFDPVAIQGTLRNVGFRGIGGHRLNTASLLQAILASDGADAIEQAYGFGFGEWGTIIREWLTPNLAIPALKRYATQGEWPTNDLTRILATLLEQEEPHRSQNAPTIDRLGLLYLRQRIQLVIDQLREQAIEHAREASRLAPSHLILGRLPSWIEIYERGAIRQALPYLISRRPLSEFIPMQNCESLFHGTGDADPQQPLTIEQVQVFKIVQGSALQRAFARIRRQPPMEEARVATFQVCCVLRGEAGSQPVLLCKSIPYDTYLHLTSSIQRLSGKNLSTLGASLGDRILNTLVPIPDRFLESLEAGVNTLGPLFAQSLVFSGIPLPVAMDIPGREDLSDQLPYGQLDPNSDLEFPQDMSAIVAELHEEYRRDDRTLEMVT